MAALALDLLAFLGTAAAAWLLDWNTGELVWGLWLSSLVVGYALIVYGILVSGLRFGTLLDSDDPRLRQLGALLPGLRLVGALFMLAFFTVHFGGFHFVHGIFLSLFFPLTPEARSDPANVFAQASVALARSWPLVLGSAVAMREAFARARVRFNPSTPYKSVVRMHVLIFVFAGASIAGWDNRVLYVIVLFFYFFPLGAVARHLGFRRGHGAQNTEHEG